MLIRLNPQAADAQTNRLKGGLPTWRLYAASTLPPKVR
jgi:hypothetical protein